MPISFLFTTTITSGEIVQWYEDRQIDYLETDSRKTVLLGEATVFFALKNPNGRNGHDFVQAAYQKGIRNFVISETVSLPKDANVLMVENVLLALQKIASHHRQQYKYPTIGITGSNGKTIVKEWLTQLLRPHFIIVRSPKSYNSQIGVPFSVWQMQEGHNLAIFEAGISEPKEMEKLASIILPDFGLFTNIGSAHDLGFDSLEEKINEKLKLFAHCKRLIFCADHHKIKQAIEKKDIPTFSWSKSWTQASGQINEHQSKADLVFKKQDGNPFAYQVIPKNKILERSNPLILDLPFSNTASIENSLHCIACIWLLIVEYNILELSVASSLELFASIVSKDHLNTLQTMPMRLSQKTGLNNCLLIDDTYNSDLSSLQIALDFQQQQNNHLQNVLVLTDILEAGIADQELYSKVAQMLAARDLSRFVGIGPQLFEKQELFLTVAQQTNFYKTTEEFIKALPRLAFQAECVLFKGARFFQLEQAVNRLSEKLHQTSLEININALIDNLKVYKSLLKPRTKIMAMVKAFSYGAGSYEIANVLQFQGVDYLCVAYTDEGIALRKAGIQLPIMVLSPAPNTFSALLSEQLEPEIYSLSHLKKFTYFLTQNKLDAPVNIHLNIDTGMHRLGFIKEDLPVLLEILKNNKQVNVSSVFSHFIASEDVSSREFTQKQYADYTEIVEQVEEVLKIKVIKHISNTAGIVHFPEMQLDMVRLGLGLYGIDSTQRIQSKLQIIGKFKSHIAQIREVSKGEGVGYNWSELMRGNAIIAIVNVGYGDGLLRKASNGRFSLKLGTSKVPIVGKVCMDMCMVDVSNCPDVAEGDEVVIFDDIESVIELANALETIPYEVLTNLSNRVKRIYIQE